MARTSANGIEIEYSIDGPQTGEVVLMIAGLGGQMVDISGAFGTELLRRGYRLITFDNRDIGLSTHLSGAGHPDMAAVHQAIKAGEAPPVAYDLHDMADDAVGLLDALGIRQAHLVGVSMGGMIAQLVAAAHPERTRSLTSIMSTTGNPALPSPTPQAQKVMSTPPRSNSLDDLVEANVSAFKVLAGPGYPTADAVMRERARRSIQRAFDPDGVARQAAAVVASGDLRPRSKTITARTIVVHGEDDPIFPPAHARDLVETITGAELRMIPGMGHDFPDTLAPVLAEAVDDVIRRTR